GARHGHVVEPVRVDQVPGDRDEGPVGVVPVVQPLLQGRVSANGQNEPDSGPIDDVVHGSLPFASAPDVDWRTMWTVHPFARSDDTDTMSGCQPDGSATAASASSSRYRRTESASSTGREVEGRVAMCFRTHCSVIRYPDNMTVSDIET